MRIYVQAFTRCAQVGRATTRSAGWPPTALTHRRAHRNSCAAGRRGFETTVNLIGNGIVVLLQNPSSWHGCAMTPTCGPRPSRRSWLRTVPVQMTARTAGCDVEIAGMQIAACSLVALLAPAAPATPYVFTDPAASISRGPTHATTSPSHPAYMLALAPPWPASKARPHGVHSSKPSPSAPGRTRATAWSGQFARIHPAASTTWAADGQLPRTCLRDTERSSGRPGPCSFRLVPENRLLTRG